LSVLLVLPCRCSQVPVPSQVRTGLGFDVVVVEEFDVEGVVELEVEVVVEVELDGVVDFDAGFEVEPDDGFPFDGELGVVDGLDVDADEPADVVCPKRFKTAIEQIINITIAIRLMDDLLESESNFSADEDARRLCPSGRAQRMPSGPMKAQSYVGKYSANGLPVHVTYVLGQN